MTNSTTSPPCLFRYKAPWALVLGGNVRGCNKGLCPLTANLGRQASILNTRQSPRPKHNCSAANERSCSCSIESQLARVVKEDGGARQIEDRAADVADRCVHAILNRQCRSVAANSCARSTHKSCMSAAPRWSGCDRTATHVCHLALVCVKCRALTRPAVAGGPLPGPAPKRPLQTSQLLLWAQR